MQDMKKFLYSSKKLEARHTDCKSKEAEEVYTFNIQKEYHRNREFERLLEFTSTYDEHQNEAIKEGEDSEQEIADIRQNAPENAFDIIAELQGFDFGNQPHSLKQIPPGTSSDIFVHEMSDVVEEQLQKETTYNERSVEKGQTISEEEPEYWEMEEVEEDEQKDGPHNVFYFRPVKRRRK